MIASTTASSRRRAAKIQRRIGVSKEEFLKRLKALKFSAAEQRELKTAMEASAKVFGYAGGH